MESELDSCCSTVNEGGSKRSSGDPRSSLLLSDHCNNDVSCFLLPSEKSQQRNHVRQVVVSDDY